MLGVDLDVEDYFQRLHVELDRVDRAEVHDLADSVKANPSAEDFAWYAVFPESAIEITELTDGAEWMLHLFLEKDLPLIGSFSMLSLEDEYQKRKIEHETLGHVVGTMKVNWFKFGNTFVEGTERDI